MHDLNKEQFRFPIGKYETPTIITSAQIIEWKGIIAALPNELRAEVAELTANQLDTRYRPKGWTIRQVVHHLADSHLNAYMRFKLALTEDCPTIRPYAEPKWAELPDGKSGPIGPSLDLLQGLHARWVLMLDQLNAADLAREYVHPEHRRNFRLDDTIGIYAWHCGHHMAHITRLKAWKGWQ